MICHTPAPRCALALALALLSLGACTFYSTATHWHDRIGPNGKQVFYKSGTRVGFNLLILLPFLGRTDIDQMIDGMTETIAKDEGNVVRVVQAGTEYYWYGFSPLTWIITPVVSSIDVEYEPSERELAKVLAEQGQHTPRQVEPLDLPPIDRPDR